MCRFLRGNRTVGLREVNQQAGRVYREVESSGVPVTVTDHGRPIAQIVPIRHDESWYERMVREGKVRPAADGLGAAHQAVGGAEGFDLEQWVK